MLTSAEKIEQQILHPAAYKISDIKVLKAWGQIPKNNQIGPTCGIYALDAAMQIQGRDIAPRKKESHRPYSAPGEVSLLKGAKLEGLTKVGEIGRAQDLATLAACFGVGVRIERFGSEGELWSIILRAVAGNHALVLPYSCTSDDGSPAWSRTSTGFAHWCLLFGYVAFFYKEPLKHVFLTTYGTYHEVSPYQLFKSNQRIQDWPRQKWVKVILWCKAPGLESPWFIWKADWRSESTLLDGIKMTAKSTGPGWGFGIGNKQQVLHKFVDPPKPMNVSISDDALAKLVMKSVDLEEIKYTETLCGQCVVV